MKTVIAVTDVRVVRRVLKPTNRTPEADRLLELIAKLGAFQVDVDLDDEQDCKRVARELGIWSEGGMNHD